MKRPKQAIALRKLWANFSEEEKERRRQQARAVLKPINDERKKRKQARLLARQKCDECLNKSDHNVDDCIRMKCKIFKNLGE